MSPFLFALGLLVRSIQRKLRELRETGSIPRPGRHHAGNRSATRCSREAGGYRGAASSGFSNQPPQVGYVR